MANLNRFHIAQQTGDTYTKAYNEIVAGAKTSHWIWYIFPQIKGLGISGNTAYYSIENLQEACDYLQNKKLFDNYQEISRAVLQQLEKGIHVRTLMGGDIDARKLASSMTLFRLTASFMAKQGMNKEEYSALEECCDKILAKIKIQGYSPCKRTLELVEPELKEKLQKEAKKELKHKAEQPVSLVIDKRKSSEPPKPVLVKSHEDKKQEVKKTVTTPSIPIVDKGKSPEKKSAPILSLPKEHKTIKLVINKEKSSKEIKKSFFTTSSKKIKDEPPVQIKNSPPDYSTLSKALDTYIKERTNEWNFHYNFLGIVAAIYWLMDAIVGTEHFNSKNREIKLSAARNLKQLIESPDCSECIVFTHSEKKALADGRLGKIVKNHGGFDSIVKNLEKKNHPSEYTPNL